MPAIRSWRNEATGCHACRKSGISADVSGLSPLEVSGLLVAAGEPVKWSNMMLAGAVSVEIAKQEFEVVSLIELAVVLASLQVGGHLH